MLSYGSMVTAMLACFVALGSLAEDQTGADLQAGMASLNDALHSGGTSRSSGDKSNGEPPQAFAASPQYVLPLAGNMGTHGDTDDLTEESADNELLNREEQDYQRFLNELERMSSVQPLPAIEGDVSFDCFDRLADNRPAIPSSLWESVRNLQPLFGQKGYEMELTVWAPTPTQSAWTRAAAQSITLRDAIAERLDLTDDMASRFHAVSRPWLYSNLDRPTVSMTVRRLKSE